MRSTELVLLPAPTGVQTPDVEGDSGFNTDLDLKRPHRQARNTGVSRPVEPLLRLRNIEPEGVLGLDVVQGAVQGLPAEIHLELHRGQPDLNKKCKMVLVCGSTTSSQVPEEPLSAPGTSQRSAPGTPPGSGTGVPASMMFWIVNRESA